MANMVSYANKLKYPWHIDIIMIAIMPNMVEMPIKIVIDGEERETLVDPLVKKIDKMGRVYIDRELAEQVVTITVSSVKPGDKEKWIKVGRG